MNYRGSYERTVDVGEHVCRFAVFGSIGAIAVFKNFADAEDFARYIAKDQQHTRTFVAEVKLDIRSEVVSGDIGANNTFIPRHVMQKLGLNGGGVTVIRPERLPGGGWSHVWPPVLASNAW